MKTPEPALVVQGRKILRRLCSCLLSHAGLILVALVPQGVVAQTYLDVTLRGTQFNVTAQAPGAASFTVRYRYDDLGHAHAWFCDWPPADEIAARYEALDAAGELPAHLTRMNQQLNQTFSPSNVRGAMHTFFPNMNSGRTFTGVDREFTRQQLTGEAPASASGINSPSGAAQSQQQGSAGLQTVTAQQPNAAPRGPLIVDVATRCLNESQAWSALGAIRGVVRTYLAPPAN